MPLSIQDALAKDGPERLPTIEQPTPKSAVLESREKEEEKKNRVKNLLRLYCELVGCFRTVSFRLCIPIEAAAAVNTLALL